MTQVEMKEKIEALAKDEAFAAKVKACETVEALAALYNAEGIAVEAADLAKAMEAMENGNQDDELNEDSLDNVSGGCGGAFLAWAIIYSVVVITGSVQYAKSRR